MLVRRVLLGTLILTLGTVGAAAEAQSGAPAGNLTLTAGYAGFIDESLIKHVVGGGGAEWVVIPRIAVGPEVLYMVGPGSDRDLFIVGMARVGILPFNRRIIPFATAGGGLMVHWDRFGRETFRTTEGAFMFGGGVRVALARNVYVAPEFTIGWEPHLRASVNVGIRR